jgi:hypothetical protein
MGVIHYFFPLHFKNASSFIGVKAWLLTKRGRENEAIVRGRKLERCGGEGHSYMSLGSFSCRVSTTPMPVPEHGPL